METSQYTNTKPQQPEIDPTIQHLDGIEHMNILQTIKNETNTNGSTGRPDRRAQPTFDSDMPLPGVRAFQPKKSFEPLTSGPPQAPPGPWA